MWKPEQVARDIAHGPIYEKLQRQTQAEVKAIPQDELVEAVTSWLCRPQPRGIPHGRILPNLVYAAQYQEVFDVLKLPGQLSIYEPCAGGIEYSSALIDDNGDTTSKRDNRNPYRTSV